MNVSGKQSWIPATLKIAPDADLCALSTKSPIMRKSCIVRGAIVNSFLAEAAKRLLILVSLVKVDQSSYSLAYLNT